VHQKLEEHMESDRDTGKEDIIEIKNLIDEPI